MKKNIKIAAYVLIICALFTSCEDLWDECIEGNGDKMVETRVLSEFNAIEINGDFKVQIDTGRVFTAVLTADGNLVDEIVTHVSDNKLVIETRDGQCINPSHTIEIKVSTQMLNQVIINGSGYIYCHGLNADELSLDISGSGRIKFDNVISPDVNIDVAGSGMAHCEVISENVTTELAGSGEILLTGICTNASHKIIGSGKIKAGEMTSAVCSVNISGSGIAYTHVTNTLEATISGSGIVYYSGNPTVESYVSGSGKVIKR